MALPLSVIPRLSAPTTRVPSSRINASPFREDYADRLVDIFGLDSIVSYLPLDERVGSVAYDYTNKSRNGAYTAVTLGQAGIGDGRSAGNFDGSTSFCNWYSAALAGAFNGAEGTLLTWARLASLGVNRWTASLTVNASNRCLIQITAGNEFSPLYAAGGTSETLSTGINLVANIWYCLAMTWSASGDFAKAYLDGLQKATSATLGVFAGALSSTATVVGAASTTPTSPWDGRIAHALLLNRAAPDWQIGEAYRAALN